MGLRLLGAAPSAPEHAIGLGRILTPTAAVKTTTYTAAVGELVPCDATSAAFTVTLPPAPADKSQIMVKKVDASTNYVTVSCGGTDVFEVASGPTTRKLIDRFHSVTVQYKSSSGIWYVIAMAGTPVWGGTTAEWNGLASYESDAVYVVTA